MDRNRLDAAIKNVKMSIDKATDLLGTPPNEGSVLPMLLSFLLDEMRKADGCAYCTSDELKGYALEIVHGKYPKLIGLSNKCVMSSGQTKFSYCPNCGRKLND